MSARDMIRALEMGATFPFDAPDSWWEGADDAVEVLPPADWAHAAARGVLADLTGRRGIKSALEGIDEGCRREIVRSLAAIIRKSHESEGGGK